MESSKLIKLDFRVYFLTRHSWATSLCHQNELNLVVLSFKGGRFMRMMHGVRMALFIFGTIPRWLDSSSIPFNNLNGQQGNKPTTSLPQNCTLFENHKRVLFCNFVSEASYLCVPKISSVRYKNQQWMTWRDATRRDDGLDLIDVVKLIQVKYWLHNDIFLVIFKHSVRQGHIKGCFVLPFLLALKRSCP